MSAFDITGLVLSAVMLAGSILLLLDAINSKKSENSTMAIQTLIFLAWFVFCAARLCGAKL